MAIKSTFPVVLFEAEFDEPVRKLARIRGKHRAEGIAFCRRVSSHAPGDHKARQGTRSKRSGLRESCGGRAQWCFETGETEAELMRSQRFGGPDSYNFRARFVALGRSPLTRPSGTLSPRGAREPRPRNNVANRLYPVSRPRVRKLGRLDRSSTAKLALASARQSQRFQEPSESWPAGHRRARRRLRPRMP
jgi:hypothetical protein